MKRPANDAGVVESADLVQPPLIFSLKRVANRSPPCLRRGIFMPYQFANSIINLSSYCRDFAHLMNETVNELFGSLISPLLRIS